MSNVRKVEGEQEGELFDTAQAEGRKVDTGAETCPDRRGDYMSGYSRRFAFRKTSDPDVAVWR